MGRTRLPHRGRLAFQEETESGWVFIFSFYSFSSFFQTKQRKLPPFVNHMGGLQAMRWHLKRFLNHSIWWIYCLFQICTSWWSLFQEIEINCLAQFFRNLRYLYTLGGMWRKNDVYCVSLEGEVRYLKSHCKISSRTQTFERSSFSGKERKCDILK